MTMDEHIEDPAGLDIEAAWRQKNQKQARGGRGSKDARRKAENTRARRATGEPKTDQINLRLSRSMRANVRAWAYALGETETQFSELAWIERARAKGIIPADAFQEPAQ